MMVRVRGWLGTFAGVAVIAAMWMAGVRLAASRSEAPAVHAVTVSQGQSPSNPHGDLDIACSQCHTTASWTKLRQPLGFDHAKVAGFPLVGGHESVDCATCHESLQFQFVPAACADCHGDPHRGELGFGCETCHTSEGWQNRQQMFIYHFTTQFPLQGAHATVECDACHTAPPPFEFHNTPTDCASCHVADYEATTEPNHIASGFPPTCEACHQDTSWQSGVQFDHTAFPLTGAHLRTDCSSCHVDGFAGTPTDCYSCHAADYDATTDPNHAQAGFPTDCESCHTTTGWGGAVLDHDAFFPLLGAHDRLDCESCHVDGVFAGTPTDCVSCHQVDYDGTTDPNHADAGFPTDCETCHGEQRWDDATFDHDAYFTLIGAHERADCASCHVNGQYAGTPTDCYSCHRNEYDNTTDPDHAKAGFPTDCETCHTPRKWDGATFDHDQFFQIQGAHNRLDCENCHVDGQYAGTPTDCFSCHQTEYDNTRDPNHAKAGFPTDCETCHTQQKWDGATFDHDQFFQLLGAHTKLDCENCHVNGQYAGTPTDCYSCHQTEYDNTKDPNHAKAGFPTDCETCHSQNKWNGATFNHDQFFQLVGAHQQVDCASCHVNGVYAGTPTDCYSCHKVDYDNTNNPNHAAAGFPTDCEACHTARQWEGAVFDHDGLFFPIYSGSHRGEWNACTDCHVNPNDFGQFECINCHEHNQSKMADEHSGVSGYQWVSTACLQCHPQGRAEDDRWGIANLIWTLQKHLPDLRPPNAWRSVPQVPQ